MVKNDGHQTLTVLFLEKSRLDASPESCPFLGDRACPGGEAHSLVDAGIMRRGSSGFGKEKGPRSGAQQSKMLK